MQMPGCRFGDPVFTGRCFLPQGAIPELRTLPPGVQANAMDSDRAGKAVLRAALTRRNYKMPSIAKIAASARVLPAAE